MLSTASCVKTCMSHRFIWVLILIIAMARGCWLVFLFLGGLVVCVLDQALYEEINGDLLCDSSHPGWNFSSAKDSCNQSKVVFYKDF